MQICVLKYIDVFWITLVFFITLMYFELHRCILNYTDVLWITSMYFQLPMVRFTMHQIFGQLSLPLFADIVCAWTLGEDEMGICK